MSLSIANLIKVKEIRTKILITLGLLFCYRIGFQVPLPGVNLSRFLDAAASGPTEGFGRLIGIMNVLTGARLQQASLFSLGVMPYISASIILSLMVKVVPSLEKLSKEGQSGQRKINRYTRYLTIPICLVQSFFVIFGALSGAEGELLHEGVRQYELLYYILVMISLTTGTLFIMWLGEQISEHGVGNGISLIIMAGIVARLPQALFQTVQQLNRSEFNFLQVLLLGVFALGVVAFIVFCERGQRRIPVQYAKRVVGRRVYGGRDTHLPLKINMAGVIPPIFSSSLMVFPATIGSFWRDNVFLQEVQSALSMGTTLYLFLYALLTIFFCYFYTSVTFDPADVAENLQKHGG
ncbi:MAG: preprotein translocase subunit SecY, partial [Planctomycetota bacterium]|nr:preprotein translocase subunit SecY [Planctomycetota bacterium]